MTICILNESRSTGWSISFSEIKKKKHRNMDTLNEFFTQKIFLIYIHAIFVRIFSIK